MSYYRHHVFFCLNQRSNAEACCAQHDAQVAFDHCKKRVKDAGLAGPGGSGSAAVRFGESRGRAWIQTLSVGESLNRLRLELEAAS